MSRHLDQPKIDKSRRGALGAVWALVQFRRTSLGAAPRPPQIEGATDGAIEGKGERPHELAFEERWSALPMIKPSTHQRVASDTHRQDWP
jgi:hypothetical protein